MQKNKRKQEQNQEPLPEKKQKTQNPESNKKKENTSQKNQKTFNKNATAKQNTSTNEPKNKKQNKQNQKFKEKNNKDNKDENPSEQSVLPDLNKKMSKITSKETPQTEKHAEIDQILKKLSGILKQLIHKRDGSRCVQACIKYGNKAQQEKIYDILLQSKDLDEIVKSKYGHFVILKFIKYVKSKQYKNGLFDVLYKNVRFLVSHVEGSKVLDKFLDLQATPAQFNQMKDSFVKVLNDKQEENLENLAMKLIDKQNHNPILSKHILKIALPILIPAEREKLLDYLNEKFIELLDNKEGIKLSIDAINYSTAKQRKTIIKAFKDQVLEIIKSENSSAYLAIIKLLLSIDDTVLVNKSIFSEIRGTLSDVINSKNGIQIFLALFQPQNNSLTKIEQEVKFTTSKKNMEQRTNELIEFILEDLINTLKEMTDEKLFKDFSLSRLLSGIIRYILINQKDNYYQFIFDIFDKFLNDSETNFNEQNQNLMDQTLISHHDSHRIIKNIIIVLKDIKDQSLAQQVQDKLNKLNDLLFKKINLVVQSRAVYLLIAMIENNLNKQKIVDFIKQNKKIQKIQDENNKGLALLKSLLQ